MKNFLITSTAALALFSMPAYADGHNHAGAHAEGHVGDDASEHAAKALDTATGYDAAVANASLTKILMSETRKDDRARDQYRNPKETIHFLGLTPDMTVAEYAPGGGWYSRVIAPYVADNGKFIGIQFAPDPLPVSDEAKDRIRQFSATFPGKVAGWTGMDAAKFSGYLTSTIPEEMNGTVDMVFIPRMMHNLFNWNTAASEIKAMRMLLKDDGHIGIVQHRAKADAPYSYTDGSKGYLREADIVAFMEIHGFELAKKSEINANAKDPANHEKGVWTLPPRLSTSKEDAVAKAKYMAIGESDRMTLLFKKRP